MSSFDDAFALLMKNEGGFTVDNGGATMYGVTEAVARKFGYAGEMKDLPLDIAKSIAKKNYWDPNKLDQLPSKLAFQVFDAVYNGGPAVKWLQRAIGTSQDGIVGANTIATARSSDVNQVILKFNAYRLQYLTSLGVWKLYGKGWSCRIANNMMVGAD